MESKVLRVIINKRPIEIRNKTLYEHFKIIPISKKLDMTTRRFFTHDKLKSDLTKDIGRETLRQFKKTLKFKLVHHRLMIDDIA